MNGKVTDAAVEAIPMKSMGKRKLSQLEGDGYIINGVAIFNPETGQRGLVDALGYVGWVNRAKPEAVRLRDELRERAEFEAWAQSIGAVIGADEHGNYLDSGLNYAKLGWQAALAATGKQQVGEDGFTGKPNELHNEIDLIRTVLYGYPPSIARGDALRATTALRAAVNNRKKPAQVGEVQGDGRSPAEIAAILRAMAGNYYRGHCWDHLDAEVCTQAANALAARQPGAQAPIAWGVRYKRTGLFLDLVVRTTAAAERVEASAGFSDNKEIVPFYAAPPAQGIDLGQLQRYDLDEGFDHYRGLPKDKGAHLYEDATGDWVKWDDVEALIDQRDAAPGVE